MWAQACCRIISHQNFSDQCADFGQICGWLEKCQRGHDNTCNPDWPKPAPKSTSSPQVGLMIRLVDVIEKRLVPNCLSTEYSYATLSYVWGKSNIGTTTTENLKPRMCPGGLDTKSRTLPAVIQDACSVVEKLGKRYLWVDSLCILQDCKCDQDAQIPHMDQIYYHSLFTIVALSATEAASRLPGVEPGSRPIPIQQTERTASWILSSVPPTLDRVLKLPCYETRAWTLQERLLSNRRLYFSNWQVYFQCYRYVYQE
ncbi:heterokaryon incompatibility protein-domain-containing protein, partial [Cadophora sp. MPI-SDFR-AT-0126]